MAQENRHSDLEGKILNPYEDILYLVIQYRNETANYGKQIRKLLMRKHFLNNDEFVFEKFHGWLYQVRAYNESYKITYDVLARSKDLTQLLHHFANDKIYFDALLKELI